MAENGIAEERPLADRWPPRQSRWWSGIETASGGSVHPWPRFLKLSWPRSAPPLMMKSRKL